MKTRDKEFAQDVWRVNRGAVHTFEREGGGEGARRGLEVGRCWRGGRGKRGG